MIIKKGDYYGMAHLLMIESWVGISGNLLIPLLKSLGHTYTFVTRKPEHYQNALATEKHMVFRYAESVIVTETNDVSNLIEVLRPYHFDGVITVCDYYIEIVRKVAEAFHLPCPFSAKVKTVRQKHLLRLAIDNAGLANPKYRIAHDWEEVKHAASDIGFPIVLKPVDLDSSAFVRLVQDVDDLKNAYEELENFPLNFRDQKRVSAYLIEEYMIGDEVSVESVSYHGKTTIIGVTDKSVTGKPYFIEDGHMFPAKLDDSITNELTQYVKNVLEAVGYDHGIGHTEVKLTAGGPRIVEINPRTPGNYIVELIESVTDVNLLKAFIDLSIDKEPQVDICNKRVASTAIKFLVPSRGGKISEIQGTELLKTDSHIARYHIEDCVGKIIDSPIDNVCYLGYIITQDIEGREARQYAENAIKHISIVFDD